MPCFKPLTAYRSKTVNPTGKRSIVFNQREAEDDKKIELKCGQCIGCRLDKSREWAVRCLHESSLYEANCFVTLTYNDQNLPQDGTLVLSDTQKFLKRLRKKYAPKKIRFFQCGEYGDLLNRPHYHLILFNHDFFDKVHHSTANDNKLYTSQELQELWPQGHSLIGDVTFESVAYVARYIVKKINGERAAWYYDEIDFSTGEILRELKPEFATMSRRPGIGKNWFEKYKTDVFPDDFVVVKGKKVKTPLFYLKQLEKYFPEDHEQIVEKRQQGLKGHYENNTRDRLQIREDLQILRAKRLERQYEKC